jgi:hypothetical protein
MRSADFPCAEIRPLRIGPESGKVGQHVTHSGRSQPRHVFEDADGGAKLTDEASDFGPEPSRVLLGKALAGDAGGLAGESSTENIHGRQI